MTPFQASRFMMLSFLWKPDTQSQSQRFHIFSHGVQKRTETNEDAHHGVFLYGDVNARILVSMEDVIGVVLMQHLCVLCKSASTCVTDGCVQCKWCKKA